MREVRFMKRAGLATLCALVMVGSAEAQSLGCFITADEIRRSGAVCHGQDVPELLDQTTGNPALDAPKVGNTLAFTLGKIMDVLLPLFDQAKEVTAHYSACRDTVVQQDAAINTCYAFRASLEGRLRRACGRKCNNIR
jgi:hypothetical protein